MNQNIKVRPNVTGVDLNENQINTILDYKNSSAALKRKSLENFFQLEHSQLTRKVLSRYAEADACMTRISVGTYEADIHKRLIDTLASAKRCYSYSEFLACIELCALHGEMLANYLCITSRDFLFDHSIIERLPSKNIEKIKRHQAEKFFSNPLGQKLRLLWLQHAKTITAEDKTHLEKVHESRISHFHRWVTKQKPIYEDALDCLAKISRASANHLELLGRDPGKFNEKNLNRVKRYMEIISSKS